MRAERIFRTVLTAALLLGVVGLLGLQGAETARSAGRRLGFVSEQGTGGVLVVSVTAGRPAHRGGLRADDRIVAVDGVSISHLAAYEEAAQGFRRGRPVSLHVRRGGEVRDLTLVPGVPALWGLFLLNGVTALGYLAVALLATGKSAVDPRARLLFGFAAAAALEIALPINAVGRPWLIAAAFSAYYLLTGLQIGLQLHLASVTPKRPAWLVARPWVVPLYYLAGLGIGLVSCAASLGENLGLQALPWSSQQVDTLLREVGLPVWALAVTLLLADQALRHPEPRGRHQAGLVLAGTIPWLLFAVASTALERMGYAIPDWIGPLESIVLLCYPVAVFLAVFRYHLFDIELVVRRGLIYTTLTGALMLVFYAALGAGGALTSLLLDERGSVWTVAAATLLLGLVFAPLRRALHRVIDRRFFPERYALRRRLVALAGELPALGKLPRMGSHLVARLADIFLARSATLLIADPETGLLGVLATAGERAGAGAGPLLIPLDDPGVEHLGRSGRPLPAAQVAARSAAFAQRHPGLHPADLLVPLLHQDKLVGLLVVGRKEGSGTYPAEELDLLNLLAHHVATVFENTRLFASATYESLTGLLRREGILEQLDRELERALRYGRPLAVAMADIDHFKAVNDRHGHLAGDALLKQVAQVLSEGLRGTDWIGRYGGEEFLLVLPETDLAGAAGLAEKIRSLVQGMAVPLEDGPPARVTISIGLAALAGAKPRDGRVSARDLIAAADGSLYAAKNGGRNRVHPRVDDQNESSSPALASAW